jgi:ABC-type transporter Mla MlaB component
MMADERHAEGVRLSFESDRAESVLPRVRAELRKEGVAAVTLDMTRVSRIDPSGLQLLSDVGEHARVAGKTIFLDGVCTPVYKAIQLAKLGALFRRLHHG